MGIALMRQNRNIILYEELFRNHTAEKTQTKRYTFFRDRVRRGRGRTARARLVAFWGLCLPWMHLELALWHLFW